MSAIGSLQEFFGDIIARGKNTFFGDVVFKRAMTLYAPVAGEPSLGTPHPHSFQFITAGAQNAASGRVDYDLSAQVPVGTKAISVFGYFTFGAGGGNWIFLENSANVVFSIGFNPSAAIPGSLYGIVTLNSDRKVSLVVSPNNASAMNFWMNQYWL